MHSSPPGFEAYIVSKHMNKAKKSLQSASTTTGKGELKCMTAGKKNESACKLNILLKQFTIPLKCTINPFLKNVDEFSSPHRILVRIRNYGFHSKEEQDPDPQNWDS